MTTSHINAMDHMLNDIFRKVFWEPLDEADFTISNVPFIDLFCEECDGTGRIQVEVATPHGFGRDVGVLDVKEIECSKCIGSGQNIEKGE